MNRRERTPAAEEARAALLGSMDLEAAAGRIPPRKSRDERTAAVPEKFESSHELSTEVALLRQALNTLEETITRLVSRAEFAPVKLIAYGLAGSILAGVVGAILSKVLVR